MATQDLLKIKKPTQDLTTPITSTTSYKTTAGNANSNHTASISNQGNGVVGNTGVSNYQFNAPSNANSAPANAASAANPNLYGSASEAMSYLQGLKAPGAFQSQYTPELQNLYNQIMNRGPFSYDLNGDMLYQTYKDEYMQGGRQAMMDTMGQAAALTGGYGSSYASTAGNQAYQQFLTKLNERVPELYDRAYGRWQDEGQDLYNRMNMTQGLENTDYSRWGDEYNRFRDEQNYALNLNNMLYGREQDDRKEAQNMIAQMVANGKNPSDDLLARAGWTRAEYKKMFKQAAPASKGGTSGPGPTNNGDPKWKQYGFESEAAYKEWLKKVAGTLGNVKQTLSGFGNALKQGLKDSTITGQNRPERLKGE